MAYSRPDSTPSVALNAITLVTPAQPLPAAIVPYDRGELHKILDRPAHDLYASRLDDQRMAVVPLVENAELPGRTELLYAQENIRLFSSLESVSSDIPAQCGDPASSPYPAFDDFYRLSMFWRERFSRERLMRAVMKITSKTDIYNY